MWRVCGLPATRRSSFTTCAQRDAREGGTIQENDLDELPDGQAVCDHHPHPWRRCSWRATRPRSAPTASPPVGGPQADVGVPTDVPSWVGSLLSGPNLLVADPAATLEELPGMGHKFQLFYAMVDDQDPLTLTNDVVSVLTTTDYPAGMGVAIRNLPPGIKITAFSDQIQLKYYFPSGRVAGARRAYSSR